MKGLKLAVKLSGSQNRLAKEIGVPQQNMNKWCIRGWLPVQRAKQVSDLYGIPVIDLVADNVKEFIISANQSQGSHDNLDGNRSDDDAKPNE